ncbi:unnamed protein product [Parajaminaea phylloscopi]
MRSVLGLGLLQALLMLSPHSAYASDRVPGLVESATASPQIIEQRQVSLPGSASQDMMAAKGKWRFNFGGPALHGDTLYGVGLGGWLVIESFIVPSIFDASGKDSTEVYDEWTLTKAMGKEALAPILQKHYETWYTEDDFAEMKSYGLNAVRIPIPFYAFDVQEDEPYLKLNQWDMLLKACGWAQKHGLKVLVDLHSGPHSQNGNDHSGQRGPIGWDKDPKNVQRTVEIIKTMATEFSQDKWADTVIAIELINEPRPAVNRDVLLAFYKQAYHEIRSRGNLAVVIGDSFQGAGFWNGTLRGPEYEGVIVDTHLYYLFTVPDLMLPEDKRRYRICARREEFRSVNENQHWSITGEWSPAFTDCAININGRGSGSRYDGSYLSNGKPVNPKPLGSCDFQRGLASNWTTQTKHQLGKMWELGMDSFYAGSGGFFWTWKTEPGVSEDFSYVAGIKNGWIPTDPTLRPLGYHCNGAAVNVGGNMNSTGASSTSSNSSSSAMSKGSGAAAMRSLTSRSSETLAAYGLLPAGLLAALATAIFAI